MFHHVSLRAHKILLFYSLIITACSVFQREPYTFISYAQPHHSHPSALFLRNLKSRPLNRKYKSDHKGILAATLAILGDEALKGGKNQQETVHVALYIMHLTGPDLLPEV
jgi:hypothetical protein